MTKLHYWMLIGLEAYNYFIRCTAVQLMIFPMKTNKMADRYLNTNPNFVMVVINKQSCDVARTIRD